MWRCACAFRGRGTPGELTRCQPASQEARGRDLVVGSLWHWQSLPRCLARSSGSMAQAKASVFRFYDVGDWERLADQRRMLSLLNGLCQCLLKADAEWQPTQSDNRGQITDRLNKWRSKPSCLSPGRAPAQFQGSPKVQGKIYMLWISRESLNRSYYY